MSLTEPQKKRFNIYRGEGMSPERALSLATKQADNQFNPVMQKGIDNVLFGKGSLTNAVGRGVKEATLSGFETVFEDTKKYGAGFALAKSPLSLAAGVGRGVGEILGGVAETADDLTGEAVSDFAMPYVESAVNSDVGQYLLEQGQRFDEAGRGVPSDILDVLNLAGPTALVKTGAASSIKNSIISSSRKAVETAGGAATKTTSNLSDMFRRAPKVTPEKVVKETVEAAEDKALKATAELLQSGSKKAAKGRSEKYNNADVQAMRVIRDSEVPLTSQQELADFFSTNVGAAIKERDTLLRPFLTNSVDDTYQTALKARIKELRVAGDLDEATKYAGFLKRESDLFDKIAKAAPGSKATVSQLNDRIKEINKKVSKLYDDVGGKENLLPEQKIEVQAYDLIREGIKKELDGIAGDTYKEAGLRTSGLLDAQTFSRIQRDRAKNALTGTPWEKMTAIQRAAFIKQYLPTIKDFGVSNLVKLDTKADVLDALVAEKVRLIREFGADAIIE